MKFNDTYFLNTFHKSRFQDVARRNSQIYQKTEWLVTAYLMTYTPELAQKTEGALSGNQIDFNRLTELPLTAEEEILMRFAANYYDPQTFQGPSVWELINGLSGESHKVIVNIFDMFT